MTNLRTMLLAALLTAPSMVMAVDDSDVPPAPTPTSTDCADGTVWDDGTKSCVDARSDLLDDDLRYRAVRELAYAGRLLSAQAVLATMADQSAPRVQTYWGFTHRKLGNPEAAARHYDAALAAQKDYHLARAYRAIGMVEAGLIAEAREELFIIAQLGGEGTWAHAALERSLKGRFLDY